jgi:hypothetical protein
MIAPQQTPVAQVAEALQEVTSAVGLQLDDVLALLMAGVKVTDLLDYAQAVNSNRLN